MHELTTDKVKARKLARQAAGLLAKVNEMIESDKYCPDILQQVEAVIGSLASVKRELLKGHLHHCLEHKIKDNREQTIKELMRIYHLNH